MPITGSQLALMPARLGVMRLGASRLGYYQPIVSMTINGVAVAAMAAHGLTITDTLDGLPNTAMLRVSGLTVTPVHGQEVKIGLGSLDATQLIFAGHIVSAVQVYEGGAVNIQYDLSLISYEWLLNRRTVTGRFLSTSATDLVLWIMSFTSGFTTTGVAAGLPVLDEMTFTNEEPSQALDRVKQRIGGAWVVDAAKVLHFGLTITPGGASAVHAITTADPHSAEKIARAVDLSQVRTRILVEGQGSAVSTDIAVGQTTVPLEDSSWAAAAGGTFVAGPQRPTYTGKATLDGTGSTVAGVALAPGTPAAAVVAGTAGKLDVGAYQYKAAFVLPAGESEVSSPSGSATIAAVTAPTAPSGTQTSGASGNLTVGNYGHKVTYETAAGETLASSASGAVAIADISAPSAPSGAVVSGAPGNLRAGAYGYKTTYHTPTGETVASTASSGVTIANVTAPGAPTLTAATVAGGGLTLTGSYYYAVTYLTLAGETAGGTQVFAALTGGQNAFVVTGIPTSSDGRVIGRRLYRSDVNAGSGFRFITQLNDNTTGAYTDVLADASRGAVVPADTSGSGKITVTIPVSADARVTKRSIYRTEVGGSTYYFLTTVNDNTDTSFVDNIADELLGGIPPATGTAGTGRITVTIPTSADGRVTKRGLYRTAVGGSDYKQIATIGNNTDTTFADNVPDTSRSEPEPTLATAGSGQIAVSSVPLGPAGTTARRIYRTEAGGTTFKFLRTIGDNTTTLFTDNAADSSLGEAAPVGSTVGALAASTTLRVKDLALFPAAGWVRVGDQIVTYTGRSGSSGEGTLTGIPATGVGSIGAGLAANVSVVNHPHLTGVSGILYAIPQGESVNLLVTRNDTAAQTAMAALVGGDGIHEEYIQDRRLSQLEAENRGDARLVEVKDPLVTITYQTYDLTTRSGRSVTFALDAPTSITGTFKIQRVTLSQFAGGRSRPLRTVDASSRTFSFEAILRLLKAA